MPLLSRYSPLIESTDSLSAPVISETCLLRNPDLAGRVGTQGAGLDGPGSGACRLLGVVGRDRFICNGLVVLGESGGSS